MNAQRLKVQVMTKPSLARTSRAGWFFGAGFVLLVMFLIVTFLPFKISDSRDASVPLDQIWTLTWSDLKRRDEFECRLIVEGGDGKLEFRIKDQYKVTIYDAGTVEDEYDFVFAAPISGTYSLFFDNDYYSFTGDKHVYFYYSTRRTLFTMNPLLSYLTLALSVSFITLSFALRYTPLLRIRVGKESHRAHFRPSTSANRQNSFPQTQNKPAGQSL